MSENAQPIPHLCPYCNTRNIETMTNAPYVRGFLVAYQIGYKSFIGCVKCVRNKVLGEAGLSMIIGWFSVTALIINPFLILFNFINSLFIKPKPDQVRAKLRELGIPDNYDPQNIKDVAVALAACMVAADGEIEQNELRVAMEQGESMFGEFDEAAFALLLQDIKSLPNVKDLAMILKNVMDEQGKLDVIKYLAAIAKADGHIAQEEITMLIQVGENIGIAPDRIKEELAAA